MKRRGKGGRKETGKERRAGGRKGENLVQQVIGTLACQSGRQNVNHASLKPRYGLSNVISCKINEQQPAAGLKRSQQEVT